MTCGLYTRVVDDDRFQAAIAAIEATLPTKPLVYGVSSSAKPLRLDDPGAWIKANLMAGRSRHIGNGDEHAFVWLLPRAVSSHLVLDDEPIAFLLLDFPDTPEFSSRVPDLVRAVCPAARAYRGNASPLDTRVAILEGAGRRQPLPNDGLPRPPNAPIAVPRFFGWINYWSSESCRLLEFSPDDPRARVFARVTPIDGHGVMLHLTEDPLDLSRPEHLAALTAAYDAFPAIAEARAP